MPNIFGDNCFTCKYIRDLRLYSRCWGSVDLSDRPLYSLVLSDSYVDASLRRYLISMNARVEKYRLCFETTNLGQNWLNINHFESFLFGYSQPNSVIVDCVSERKWPRKWPIWGISDLIRLNYSRLNLQLFNYFFTLGCLKYDNKFKFWLKWPYSGCSLKVISEF